MLLRPKAQILQRDDEVKLRNNYARFGNFDINPLGVRLYGRWASSFSISAAPYQPHLIFRPSQDATKTALNLDLRLWYFRLSGK